MSVLDGATRQRSDHESGEQDALPRPTTQRWQPLRIGLVDLFYYDDEQFWFHDGRLLLRGNNGTGKSKVLALTLPFLLDGSLAARRVEPDADPKKRMDWNLLLGGAHPSPERTGYSWAEFGRLDADGTDNKSKLGANAILAVSLAASASNCPRCSTSTINGSAMATNSAVAPRPTNSARRMP